MSDEHEYCNAGPEPGHAEYEQRIAALKEEVVRAASVARRHGELGGFGADREVLRQAVDRLLAEEGK